jgi:hypothetical protein
LRREAHVVIRDPWPVHCDCAVGVCYVGCPSFFVSVHSNRLVLAEFAKCSFGTGYKLVEIKIYPEMIPLTQLQLISVNFTSLASMSWHACPCIHVVFA